MIADLKPYPAMKDSGVKRLGEVPEHWENRKLRTVLRNVTARSRPDLPLLSVVREKGVIVRDVSSRDENYNYIPDDLTNYKVVRTGQFAMNKMKAWQGSYGVSSHDGIVSPAYFVFDLKDVAGDFFNAAIRSRAYVPFFTQASDGVRIGQWDLSQARMREISFSVPPPKEQAAIVRYLGYVDRRVRQLVRAKRKLIALLTEQKRAAIDAAIMKGFVRHIPRNVLGLPVQLDSHAGWTSLSVRHLIQTRRLQIQDGNHGELHPKASDYVDDGIPFLMANNVRPEGLRLQGCAMLAEEQARSLRIGFAKPGDVLLTHKATIGQVAVVPQNISWPFLMLTPQVTYYRLLTAELSSEFLFWYMQSSLFQEQLKVLSLNQSTRNYIGLLEQRNLVVCFPDSAQQQEAVLGCDRATSAISGAIERSRAELSLIDELRARLVADVVTGKSDVREVAAALPEVDPSDAEDELDALDADTEADLDDLDTIPEEAEE